MGASHERCSPAHSAGGYSAWRGLASESCSSYTRLESSATWRCFLATGSRRSRATGVANTAFASTISTGSVSSGTTGTPTMWRSWTITRAGGNDGEESSTTAGASRRGPAIRHRHARSSRPDQTGRASARGCVGSRADRVVPCRRSSAATCRLDGGDVDLLHRQHRRERAPGLGAPGGHRVGQRARGDLPGETPADTNCESKVTRCRRDLDVDTGAVSL